MTKGNRNLKDEAKRIQRSTGVKYTEALRVVELTRAARETPFERMTATSLEDGIRADECALADTGLVNWQQGSTHCSGRAILWEHLEELCVTVGAWDEYRDEVNDPPNPFAGSTRLVNLEAVEPAPGWEEHMTEVEAILWEFIGLELEEKPSGYPNWRGDDLQGAVATTARQIESDLYLRDRSLYRFF